VSLLRLCAIYPSCIPHTPAEGGTSSMITPCALMDPTTMVQYLQEKPKFIVADALNPILSVFMRWMMLLSLLDICYRGGAMICFTMFVSTILLMVFSFIFDLHTSVGVTRLMLML